MNIVIATGIYPPEIGGPAGYSKRLGLALVERGYDIRIVTYGDENTERSGQWSVVSGQTENAVRVVKRDGGPLVRYFRYALAVLKAAKTADLVYLMGPVSEGLPGTIGAMLAGKKTVLKVVGDYAWEQYQQSTKYDVRSTSGDVLRTPHSVLELLDEFLTHGHGGKIGLFEKIERWVARRAEKVIVPSKYLKTVVTKWGIEQSKIEVIYNSVEGLPDSEISLNLPLSRKTSEDYTPLPKGDGGISVMEGKKIILTAVRAVPWKGGDFLCDCLKELPGEFMLAVAGDGPSLEGWKKYAQDIGVADRVIWLGKLPRHELAYWYRKADVFALATGYEGFPHVVVEACSVGLRCVVSDMGGNPETAEMMPGMVRVAPYRKLKPWVEAILQTAQDGRVTQSVGLPGALEFEAMVNATQAILTDAIEYGAEKK